MGDLASGIRLQLIPARSEPLWLPPGERRLVPWRPGVASGIRRSDLRSSSGCVRPEARRLSQCLFLLRFEAIQRVEETCEQDP